MVFSIVYLSIHWWHNDDWLLFIVSTLIHCYILLESHCYSVNYLLLLIRYLLLILFSDILLLSIPLPHSIYSIYSINWLHLSIGIPSLAETTLCRLKRWLPLYRLPYEVYGTVCLFLTTIVTILAVFVTLRLTVVIVILFPIVSDVLFIDTFLVLIHFVDDDADLLMMIITLIHDDIILLLFYDDDLWWPVTVFGVCRCLCCVVYIGRRILPLLLMTEVLTTV